MANVSAGKPEKKQSRFSPKRILKYFRDLKSELKKIVWPTKNQIVNNTIIVIIMVLIAAVVLWGLDTILGFLVQLLLGSA